MASGPESDPPSPPLSLLGAMLLGLLSQQEPSLDAPTHAIAVFDDPAAAATRTLFAFRGAPPDLGPLLEVKSGPPPASRASIDALPRAPVAEDGEESGDCAICLEEHAVGDEAREMPCRHRFHSGCIEMWLSMHGTCPVCRFAMPPEEDAKVLDEGGEDRARSRRPIVVVLVINGRVASNTGSGHERSPGSDDSGSVDSSPAQDTDS
ncbi:hypothetical protein NL676_005204 [Syzygium grande]|nr:hypothetical protein NL676_005204 [Syzygium grande]